MFYKLDRCYVLREWPPLHIVWEHVNADDLITFGQIVCEDYIYCYRDEGLGKLSLRDGKVIWDKSCEEWSTSIDCYKRKEPLTVKTEHTGIYADTLVLALAPKVVVGIDIENGDIRWVIDVVGNQRTKITEDGIAYFVRTEGIYRIDVASGTLLPLLPIKYSPILEKVESARLGGWDMSTTHIIAEVSTRTTKGYTEGHIVGINIENGQVDWAVPITGTVIQLMLLNNRIYVTGMLATLDNPKAGFNNLIIEGEGGYIPD